MKRYKLLKDLPYAKAGKILEIYLSDDKKWLHIFDENREEIYQLKVGYNVLETHNEWFKEIKESEEYFYITTDGFVYFAIKGKDEELENNRKAIGNYFETEEEAEKYLKYLKAKTVIKQDTKGFKPDWSNGYSYVYFGCWNNRRNELYADSTTSNEKYTTIYFKTKKDLLDSFKKYPEEWKVYLTYEQ